MKKKLPLFRRKRNVKLQVLRRRSRYLVWGVTALGLLAALGWGSQQLLSRLELLALKKIEVLGNPKSLEPEAVIRLAGVEKGVNLFKIDLQEVQGRLKKHEFFKNTFVHRRLPGTLVIEVEEYLPEFILHTGRMYYIDSEGVIFKDITESDAPRDFPILTGVTEEFILRNPAKVREVMKDAVRLKAAYYKSEFYSRFGLSEVHFEKNIGFTLYPELKKYSIKFGTDDFPGKVEKLGEVWTQLENSKVKVSSIDLNYPGKVLMTL